MKTIIIPPKNMITKVYVTQINPTLWRVSLRVREKATKPNLIMNGDLVISTSKIEHPSDERIIIFNH